MNKTMKNGMAITAPSQKHLLVADIRDDIILTKEGGAALVLETSALNFSLLSEKEQDAMIFAYAALLNSLSFPIQILVRSRKKDVSRYLKFLKEKEEKISKIDGANAGISKLATGAVKNSKLAELMTTYREFVASIVKKKNVLEKDFYIIIPFSPYELGLSVGELFGILPSKRARKVPFPKDYVIKKAKTVLYPRRDHIIRQSGRLGIKIRQLTTEELSDIFLEIYNPKEEAQKEGGEKNG